MYGSSRVKYISVMSTQSVQLVLCREKVSCDLVQWDFCSRLCHWTWTLVVIDTYFLPVHTVTCFLLHIESSCCNCQLIAYVFYFLHSVTWPSLSFHMNRQLQLYTYFCWCQEMINFIGDKSTAYELWILFSFFWLCYLLIMYDCICKDLQVLFNFSHFLTFGFHCLQSWSYFELLLHENTYTSYITNKLKYDY